MSILDPLYFDAIASHTQRTSVAFRRGATTLPAQDVHVLADNPKGERHDTAQTGGQEARSQRWVMGAAMLDIQPEDRFNLSGALYKVIFVDPYRDLGTVATCEAVQ